jgi:hypothetical protein
MIGIKGVPFCDPKWRINSFCSGNHFKVRLGSHFKIIWTHNFGNDSKGYACAAEMTGFGLTD